MIHEPQKRQIPNLSHANCVTAQEAAWPSVQLVGLAIRLSVRVPLRPLAGFVLRSSRVEIRSQMTQFK